MSHYEKLAVVIIRAVGCCLAVYSCIGVPYNLLKLWLHFGSDGKLGLIASLVYLIVGLTLFALSKPLGALSAKGLSAD